MFKSKFQLTETVADYLVHFAPPDLVEKMDLKSLDEAPTNSIFARLTESFADVVYRGVWKDRPGGFVILFEHKSAPEQKPQRQLLKYIQAVWDKIDKAGQPESFVFPVIFHQGEQS